MKNERNNNNKMKVVMFSISLILVAGILALYTSATDSKTTKQERAIERTKQDVGILSTGR